MLPKIDVPIFDVKLFSTGKKVKFRPFKFVEKYAKEGFLTVGNHYR